MLSEEERKFKIEKIKKCDSLAEQESNKVTLYRFRTAITTLAAIMYWLNLSSNLSTLSLESKAVRLLLACCFTVSALSSAHSQIKALLEMTNFEKERFDLDFELQYDVQEKANQKGMR